MPLGGALPGRDDRRDHWKRVAKPLPSPHAGNIVRNLSRPDSISLCRSAPNFKRGAAQIGSMRRLLLANFPLCRSGGCRPNPDSAGEGKLASGVRGNTGI